MGDGDYPETANLAPGDRGLDGLLADLLHQWEEEEGVPLEALAEGEADFTLTETIVDSAPPVESTLAQLAEAVAIQPPEPQPHAQMAEAVPDEAVLEAEAVAIQPPDPQPQAQMTEAVPDEAVLEAEEGFWETLPGALIEEPVGATLEQAEHEEESHELVAEFESGVEGIRTEPDPETATAEPVIAVSIIEPVEVEPEPEPEMVVRAPVAVKTRAEKNEELLAMVRNMYQAIQQRRSGGGVAGKDGFVVVRLGEQQCGISIRRVVETDRMPRVTAVPLVPDFVAGVVNLRGEVLPLVDLRVLLGFKASSGGRMVVIRPKEGEGGTALLVDGLAGIAWLDRNLLASGHAPDSKPADGIRLENLVSATGLHRDKQLRILDLDRLFASKELRELRIV